MVRIFIALLFINFCYSQSYYVYVAAESDDTVSVLKFDGDNFEETDRVTVGIMPTENEGPHGITIDPSGKYWYLTLAHGSPNGSLVKYSTENNEPLSKVELGLFPATMQISPKTGLLYAANFNLHGLMRTSTVSVVDPENMVEITKIKTGIMPHGSRISTEHPNAFASSISRRVEYNRGPRERMATRRVIRPGRNHFRFESYGQKTRDRALARPLARARARSEAFKWRRRFDNSCSPSKAPVVHRSQALPEHLLLQGPAPLQSQALVALLLT